MPSRSRHGLYQVLCSIPPHERLRDSDSTATWVGLHTYAVKVLVLSASIAVSGVLGLLAPTQPAAKANARLAAELLKVTVPGWTSARNDAATESADLIKEMKSTYTGTIAATGRTWTPSPGSPQFVNINLVAYLHPPRAIRKDLRRLVSKDAWVLCGGLTGGKSATSSARLASAGDGLLEHCADGQVGAIFTKANVLVFIGMHDPADPTAITRIAAAQYRALPPTSFQG